MLQYWSGKLFAFGKEFKGSGKKLGTGTKTEMRVLLVLTVKQNRFISLNILYISYLEKILKTTAIYIYIYILSALLLRGKSFTQLTSAPPLLVRPSYLLLNFPFLKGPLHSKNENLYCFAPAQTKLMQPTLVACEAPCRSNLK